MAIRLKSDWKPTDNVLFAHTSCLCLGIGMILWSLAPAVVERALTGIPPSAETIVLNSLIFMLGLAFVGMHVLIRRRILWGVWTAFLVSATLAAAGLALSTLTGIQLNSSFLLLLSGWTCFATWLAIATLARERSRPTADDRP